MSDEESQELHELIRRGKMLQRHIRFASGPGTGFIMLPAEQWLTDADNFIRQSLPWFHDRYLSDVGLEVVLPWGVYTSDAQEGLYMTVTKRLMRLEEAPI